MEMQRSASEQAEREIAERMSYFFYVEINKIEFV